MTSSKTCPDIRIETARDLLRELKEKHVFLQEPLNKAFYYPKAHICLAVRNAIGIGLSETKALVESIFEP